MQYTLYKSQFEAKRAALEVPPDCVVGEPQFFISTPNTWHMVWFLTFNDDHYIRCRELWSHRTGYPARRHQFTLHYGPIVAWKTSGEVQPHHTDPVIIRIDLGPNGPTHLHYGDPEPHYYQDELEGIDLVDVDMFAFIEAIFKSRAEGTEVRNILGFRIR